MPLLFGHHLSIHFINTFVEGDGKWQEIRVTAEHHHHPEL
jgi:hypothetical protein